MNATEWLRTSLTEGLRDIQSAQRNIAQYRIYQVGRNRVRVQEGGPTVKGRSGMLMQALRANVVAKTDGSGVTGRLNYPVYIRFLDMKEHGNYKIYNRQIWGILYKETFPTMRYEAKEEVREQLSQELQRIYQNNTL